MLCEVTFLLSASKKSGLFSISNISELEWNSLCEDLFPVEI